jgi:hypothetical protein
MQMPSLKTTAITAVATLGFLAQKASAALGSVPHSTDPVVRQGERDVFSYVVLPLALALTVGGIVAYACSDMCAAPARTPEHRAR